jgi:hypothetical protein
MAHNFKYSLRVWLTGGVLAPLLFTLFNLLIRDGILTYETSMHDIGMIIGYCLVMGLVCSIPSLLVLWLAVTLLHGGDMSVSVKKLILIILTFCLMVVSFRLFPGGGISAVDSPGLELFIAYFLAICGGLIYYRIEKVTSPEKMGEENIVS